MDSPQSHTFDDVDLDSLRGDVVAEVVDNFPVAVRHMCAEEAPHHLFIPGALRSLRAPGAPGALATTAAVS